MEFDPTKITSVRKFPPDESMIKGGFKEKSYRKVWAGKPEDFYNSVEIERESNWKYEPVLDDVPVSSVTINFNDETLKKIDDMCEDIKSIKEIVRNLTYRFT